METKPGNVKPTAKEIIINVIVKTLIILFYYFVTNYLLL